MVRVQYVLYIDPSHVTYIWSCLAWGKSHYVSTVELRGLKGQSHEIFYLSVFSQETIVIET